MPEFTPAQKRAIETRGCDLLVSAAAGSGKTAVLSERVLRQLTDPSSPVDIDQFLIVTFTNAAAAEMKDRISRKISEALEDKALGEQLRSRLLRQMTLIGKASITTIHSFCLDIIRNNFQYLDIDPMFRIGDENETRILKLQMAERMLEEEYGGENPPLFSQLCKWLGGGKDEALVEKILQIYEFIQSFPDPLEWLDTQVEKYAPKSLLDVDALEWTGEMKQSYRVRLESVAEQCEKLVRYAVKSGVDFYAPALESDLERVGELYEKCGGKWEALYDAAAVFEFQKLARKPKDADPEVTGFVTAQRTAVKKEIAKIREEICAMPPHAVLEGLGRAYPLLKSLQHGLLTFHRLYQEKKRQQAMLDFNDFEHLALRLLRDQSNGVAQQLRDKYQEIFVDEYQDCNSAQEEIFLQICRKKGGKPCNMFMVGDVKQSIYRFRQADPTIFLEKSKTYPEGSGLQQKVTLNKNFRSSYCILECVNHLFSRIMSEYAGELEYTGDQRLYYREDGPQEVAENDRCELLVADTGEMGELEETAQETEARMVAERILQLFEEGKRPRDIVVLLRGLSTRVAAFEEAFKNCAIPYYTDGGGGYFDSLEVRIFVSLLKTVDNPLQDIPLAGLLRSPLFAFDENDLLEIRLEKQGLFYPAIEAHAAKEGRTAEKCRDFLNRLNIWRDRAVSTSVDELVEYLLEDTGLRSFAAALPGGEQRAANLGLLCAQARTLQSSGFKGLFRFISYLDRLKNHSDSAGAKVLSENSDVVRIMTIHKSKGLEFPVVFLSVCQGRLNTSDSRGSLLLHRRLGLGTDFVDSERKIKYPLISKTAVAERIRMENLSEEMRVLYVAVTRAKEKLICTAAVKNAAEKREVWKENSALPSPLPRHFTARASSYLDWISACLNDRWEVRVIPAVQVGQEAQGAREITAPRLVQTGAVDVIERLEYRYPYDTATRLPTKFSVSELKRRYDFEDVASVKLYTPALMEKPEFLQDKGISAVQAGVVNHLLLKELPRKSLTPHEVLEFADGLKERGLLKEEELSCIDSSGIAGFFSSPLGVRFVRANKAYRELQFNLPVSGQTLFSAAGLEKETVLVQGIIDCMFEENGGLVLIDFKTDRYLRPEAKEMYQVQLNIYARAAQALTGLKVTEKYLYLLAGQGALRME